VTNVHINTHSLRVNEWISSAMLKFNDMCGFKRVYVECGTVAGEIRRKQY